MGPVPFKTTDGADQHAKNNRLDEAAFNIGPVERCLQAGPVDTFVGAEQFDTGEPAAPHGDEVEEGGENGKTDEAGSKWPG